MTVIQSIASVSWTRKMWHIAGGCIIITIATFVPWPYCFFIAFATLLTWISIEAMRRRCHRRFP